MSILLFTKIKVFSFLGFAFSTLKLLLRRWWITSYTLVEDNIKSIDANSIPDFDVLVIVCPGQPQVPNTYAKV